MQTRRSGGASETQMLAAVSAAHLVSHVYLMVLPVLLPLLKQRLDVSFLDLGIALTCFGVITGLTQAPMGFVVDRFGARPILVAGLVLGGLAFASLGLHSSYAWLASPTASTTRPTTPCWPTTSPRRAWAAPFRCTRSPVSPAAPSPR